MNTTELEEAITALRAAHLDLKAKEHAWWARRHPDDWEPYQTAAWRRNNARERAHRLVEQLAYYPDPVAQT